MFTEEPKPMQMCICGLSSWNERKGDELLCNTVTGDERWVNDFEPESERQSVEYRHQGSQERKKFKASPSSRKVMLTAFWDANGVVHLEFIRSGPTINCVRYVG
jgi:hypothetical protein